MNKTDLIKAVTDSTSISKKNVSEIISKTIDILVNSFKAGEPVNLTGFGKFNVAVKEAHTARNPLTGEQVLVPARKHVSFKVSSNLKEELKN